jgi:hypothetical protein
MQASVSGTDPFENTGNSTEETTSITEESTLVGDVAPPAGVEERGAHAAEELADTNNKASSVGVEKAGALEEVVEPEIAELAPPAPAFECNMCAYRGRICRRCERNNRGN